MPQNFLYPQRDQPLLMPVDMREWLPEDDLVFVVLDAVATLDLGEFRRRYRADGHGRAAFDPEMMVALLLYGYCQGERSSRVIEKRCVRDVAYRVIAGGLRPDHATIARFRARHEKALGGLFSQVLRLLAAEGMVSLGTLSLDGTKLAGNAAQKANQTLPQIEKLLAEAAEADAAEDAQYGGSPQPATPRALARRAERRERLAAGPGPAGGRGPGPPRRAAGQAGGLGRGRGGRVSGAGGARGRAARQPQQHRAAGEHHRPGRAGDAQPERLCCRLQRPARGHRRPGHRRRDAQPAPGRPHPAAPAAGHLPPAADRGRDPPAAAHRARRLRLRQRGELRPRRRRRPAAARAAGQGPRPGAASAAPQRGPCTWTGFRPPPAPGGACAIPADATTTSSAPRPWNRCSGSSRPARN